MADFDDIDLDDWHLRKYKVPDPPQKPDFVQGVDNMHWSQFSRNLAAQLNHDKTGFNVKLYDPSDPTAYGLDPSIIPAYRLGPPSSIPDYPHMLEKYGTQVLAAAGFLNHKIDHVSKNIAGRLAFKPWRNHEFSHDMQTRIHPVFRRSKWTGITDHQYSLMLPALLLASAILDDPVTISYFHALAMPSASMKTVSHVSADLTADCKIMKIPRVLSEHQQRGTFMKLHRMTAYLRNWGFDNRNQNCTAYTDKIGRPGGGPEPAFRPNTSHSIIRIKRAFMDILEYFDGSVNPDDDRYIRLFEEIQNTAGIPMSRRAPIDQRSAMYRTFFILAQVLVHEFTHAFCFAYFEHPDSEPGEPWAPGDRANEQGWAFENFVFGGVVEPMRVYVPPTSVKFSILQSILAPFGCHTTQQWDVWFLNAEDQGWETMDSDFENDEEIPPKLVYPVPQAWTQWLFSDDLWTNQILRFGLRVIKVPKIKKWEICVHPEGHIGDNRTGEERWNTGEDTDDGDWRPNWGEFYFDGIPEEERVLKRPKWEP